MVTGLAFCAMDHCLEVDAKFPKASRLEKCFQIMEFIDTKLNSEHEFGRAFELARSEYVIATAAWNQGQIAPKQRRASRKGALKKREFKSKAKSGIKRRRLLDAEVQTIESNEHGYEVSIVEVYLHGVPKTDRIRHTLTWTEENGQEWSLDPVILPDNVIPEDGNEKRFLL